jgi:hypothetical protein
MSTNVTWHDQAVSQEERWKIGGHRGELFDGQHAVVRTTTT